MPPDSAATFRPSTLLVRRAGLSRLLGLGDYAREAWTLVWETDRRLSLALLALTVGSGALPAGIAYFGKLIIDGVMSVVTVPSAAERHTVFLLLGTELTLIATLVGVQRALGVCDALLRVRLSQRVVELVLAKALTLTLAEFEDATLYDQLRQVRDQATERPLSLVRRGLTALQLSVALLGFLAIVAAFSPWLISLLAVAALPAVLVEARFNTDAFRLFRAHSPDARRQAYLETVLTRDDHAKEVQALGLGPTLLTRHRELFHRWYREDRSLTLRRGGWGFAFALLAAAALAASYAWLVWQAMASLITVGSLAMLFAVLRQAQNSTTELLLVVAGMYDDNLYMSVLREFLSYPTRSVNGFETSGPKPEDGLRFEAVTFTYPGTQTPALHQVDLRLARGKTLAVAGRNGAGKSTLVKLALGLYTPTSGRVLLDGRDLREWDRAALNQRFSVLFQDFVRYQMSAAENIGFGDVARLSDADAWARAAERAGVAERLRNLPEGYRSQLGHWFDAGHELSVGEWQKVALAWLFMREGADILVLDEPSSSLDAQAEAEVFHQFLQFAEKRSVILISHRLAALRAADQILVLDAGRCIERGKHEELLQNSGLYAELFATQSAGYGNSQC